MTTPNFTREGRYRVIDPEGGVVSVHNEEHTAKESASAWCERHGGQQATIEPPRFRVTTPSSYTPPPTANRPGYRLKLPVSGLRLTGQRFIGGDSDAPADKSNPLWPTHGTDNAIDRFTAGLARDQNVTIGPTDPEAEAGLSLNRLDLSNGLIAHGLRHTGHPDDAGDADPKGHSHGVLVRPHARNVRLYRMVQAHNASRALAHVNRGTTGELVNVLVYNWSQQLFDIIDGKSADEPAPRWNIVGCVFREGPDTDLDGYNASHKRKAFNVGTEGGVYMHDCLYQHRDGTVSDARDVLLTQAERDAMPAEPFPLKLDPVPVIPAAELLDDLTLHNPVGAPGKYERWVLGQVRDRTGAIIDSEHELPANIREDLGVGNG